MDAQSFLDVRLVQIAQVEWWWERVRVKCAKVIVVATRCIRVWITDFTNTERLRCSANRVDLGIVATIIGIVLRRQTAALVDLVSAATCSGISIHCCSVLTLIDGLNAVGVIVGYMRVTTTDSADGLPNHTNARSDGKYLRRPLDLPVNTAIVDPVLSVRHSALVTLEVSLTIKYPSGCRTNLPSPSMCRWLFSGFAARKRQQILAHSAHHRTL